MEQPSGGMGLVIVEADQCERRRTPGKSYFVHEIRNAREVDFSLSRDFLLKGSGLAEGEPRSVTSRHWSTLQLDSL